MKLTCIAIDDEPLALDLVEKFASRIPYLDFQGRFENALASLTAMRAIDLIYLDINMPDISGMDFFRQLSSPLPQVIFTTAYDQFAVEGFELKATDYLLKPFSFDRFLKATERAKDYHLSRSPLHADVPDYILVKANHHYLRINLSDIYYIEGYKDYLKIYTHDERPILTLRPMKSIEEVLPTDSFIRIHKSYIVSKSKIKSFQNTKVNVKDRQLPIGEAYRDEFLAAIFKNQI